MLPSEYANEFNNINVLFFMETQAMSGHYEQIMLTSEAVKRVLDALAKEMKPKEDGFIVTCNDKVSIILSDVKDSYTQKEIDDELETSGYVDDDE